MVRCLIIPLDDNHLCVASNNSVYVNFSVTEMKEQNKYGSTHFIKKYLTKDEYKSMSGEERKNQPFFGSMKPSNSYENNGKNNDGGGYQKQSSKQQEKVSEYSNINADNLPF
ncbi:MAG: hypothetical protein ACI4N3_04420 [Alphaproteobacteria bacterium]